MFKARIGCDSVHRSPSCYCDAVDEGIGRVISTLKNLKTLCVECRLCGMYDRHSYLLDGIPTRHLEAFKFNCKKCHGPNNTGGSTFGSKHLFAAPNMQTITSLNLSCQSSWLVGGDGTLKTIVQRRDILPLLKSLVYDVRAGETLLGFPNKFLVSRPITRFYYPGYLRPFEESTYSCVNLECLLLLPDWYLTTIIARQPGVFAHLKHLGVFRAPMDEVVDNNRTENDMVEELRPLTALKHLHTIEITHWIAPAQYDAFEMSEQDSYAFFEYTESFLQRLADEHPSLCRIHIGDIFRPVDLAMEGMLWEREPGGVWAGREIPPLDKWDVLNGMLDVI